MAQIKELLIEELKDLLHAENQWVAALPKMAGAAKCAKLREALEKHLQQTQTQVERLNEAFELLGLEAGANDLSGHAGIARRRPGEDR